MAKRPPKTTSSGKKPKTGSKSRSRSGKKVSLTEALIRQRSQMGFESSKLEDFVIGLKGNTGLRSQVEEFLEQYPYLFDVETESGAAAFELMDEALRLSEQSLKADRQLSSEIYAKLNFLRRVASQTQGDQSEVAKKLQELIAPVEEQLRKKSSFTAFLKQRSGSFLRSIPERLVSKIPVIGGIISDYMGERRKQTEELELFTGSIQEQIARRGKTSGGLFLPGKGMRRGGGGRSEAGSSMAAMGGTRASSLFGGLGSGTDKLETISSVLHRIHDKVGDIKKLLIRSSTRGLTDREAELEGKRNSMLSSLVKSIMGSKGGGGSERSFWGGVAETAAGALGAEAIKKITEATLKKVAQSGISKFMSAIVGGIVTAVIGGIALALKSAGTAIAGAFVAAITSPVVIATAVGTLGFIIGAALAYPLALLVDKTIGKFLGFAEGDGLADRLLMAETYTGVFNIGDYNWTVSQQADAEQTSSIKKSIEKGKATAMDIDRAVRVGALSEEEATTAIKASIQEGRYEPQFLDYYKEIQVEMTEANKQGGTRLMNAGKKIQEIRAKYGYDKKDERSRFTSATISPPPTPQTEVGKRVSVYNQELANLEKMQAELQSSTNTVNQPNNTQTTNHINSTTNNISQTTANRRNDEATYRYMRDSTYVP